MSISIGSASPVVTNTSYAPQGASIWINIAATGKISLRGNVVRKGTSARRHKMDESLCHY